MSFRNRTVICGSNGLIHLSVPILRGRNQQAPFRDIRIAYAENWQLNHWRSIASCYGSAPFFNFYAPELENRMMERHTFLFDLNVSMLQWIGKLLPAPFELIISENTQLNEFESIADDISNKWLPKNYRTGQDIIRYTQVFEDRIGFQQNVSILDLLFNMGPMAGRILSS